MAKSLSDSWPQCLTLQQTLMILACGDGLMEFHSVERSLLKKKAAADSVSFKSASKLPLEFS